MNIGDQYDPDYFYLKNTASIEETVKYPYSKDDKPTDDMADDKELSEILAKLKIGQKSALGAGMGRATTIIFVDGREEAKQALLAWRDIAIAEARESTRKLYDKELKMHRDFMTNVLARENLKTDKTMSICDVCLTQLQFQRDKLRMEGNK